MVRFLGIFALILLSAAPLRAQERDSVFATYDQLYGFVDAHVAERNFVRLIQRLGGRDEYTGEELRALQSRFVAIYGRDFTHRDRVELRNMSNGFRKEVIAYWTGTDYLWLYLFTHQRPQSVVVVEFVINSAAEPVLGKM